MKQLITLKFRPLLIAVVVAVQVFSPMAVFAQEVSSDVPPAGSESTSQPTEATTETPPAQTVQEPAPPVEDTTTTQSPPPQDVQGPTQPTGAASSSYTWNPESRLWENDHYTWDPVTKQTKPKSEQTYSYNPTTGRWDTTEWYYSPEQGKYLPNTISTATNPALSSTTGGSSGNTISNTGPNSTNAIDLSGTTNGSFDLYFDATISNKIGQMSQSGNALVQGNTYGGNATSGDATSMLNLLNMIQSSWGQLASQDIALFMANINGNLVGDLVVDPSAIGSGSGSTDLDVTVTADAAINNDITVDVASGDALVTHNTEGGNATSGNANAVVNLLNLINSAITANKSFIGVLNINGSLNGDILLPEEMLNAIIAATGPNSTNQVSGDRDTSIDLTLEDNKTIRNNIATNVSSGDATVTHNTTGGSATTGDATSNVVLLNLTGQRVVAKNALLVFVNVMGSWVGLIFNAPTGTNAVLATGPNSTNTIHSTNDLDVEADITTNSLINNDVTVSASSGDATVSDNTKGGNATSGNANVGVNVLNMIDSQFDVTDWFGVLFINVFGDWVGSFGVDTDAGEVARPIGGSGGASSSSSDPSTGPASGTFGFIPRSTARAAAAVTSSNSQEVLASTSEDKKSDQGIAATTHTTGEATPSFSKESGGSSTSFASQNPNLWVAGLVTFSGILLLGGERLITMVRSRLTA